MKNRIKHSSTLTILLLVFLAACSSGEDKRSSTELDKAIENIEALGEVKTSIEKRELSDALAIIKKYALKGNQSAMFWIAEGRSLDNTDKNYVSLADSMKWLEKAALKGHVDAALSLADLYAQEAAVKSADKAYFWYYIGYYSKDGKVLELSKDRNNPVPGDFRSESGVDEVVKQLSNEKLLEIEIQAKAWLAKHYKKT